MTGRHHALPKVIGCLAAAASLIALFLWFGRQPVIISGGSDAEPSATPTSRRPNNSDRYLIVVDPGHGGEENPGCAFGNVLEKDQNLSLSQLVGQRLEDQGYDVFFTRTEDSPVDLRERQDFAIARNADVFISIHHNAQENGTDAEGIETLFNSESSPENRKLASCIQTRLIGLTQANDRGLKVRNDLTVLMAMPQPACLVEVGFLSSPVERALLVTDEYRDKLARGIAEGIGDFLDAR